MSIRAHKHFQSLSSPSFGRQSRAISVSVRGGATADSGPSSKSNSRQSSLAPLSLEYPGRVRSPSATAEGCRSCSRIKEGAMDLQMREDEPGRGRHADAPTEMTPKAWKDILWRTWGEISDDRITLIAAGATYYLLLALFPTVTAFVSLYGLFADPVTISEHVGIVSSLVPAGGIELITDQLTRLTQRGSAALGLALLVSLGIALWSSSSGIKAMFEAMNIAYDEREERGFIKLNLLALLFTLAG